MDPGHIITARGELLDISALKLKARKPMVQDNVDHKDKVTKRVIPPKQLNVRGFMPSMEGVAKPSISIQPVEPDEDEIEPTGPSMADLTGVTVDNVRHLRERPDSPIEAANETLREIMDDLDQFKGRDKPDEKRRPKK